MVDDDSGDFGHRVHDCYFGFNVLGAKIRKSITDAVIF